MALIKCSECGNMVSSMAVACPRCGCPINKMILKSRFYFDIDKGIDKGCFPIVLKVGSKEFSINSSWRGKGCICVAEVNSNEIQTNEDIIADVGISYTLQNPSWGSTSVQTINFNNITLGKDCLFNCEHFQKETRNSEDVDFFVGINTTASFVDGEEYRKLSVVDLSIPPKKTSVCDDDFDIENGILKKYHGDSNRVIIPSGITDIGKYAFGGCDDLEQVIIPYGVRNIGEEAFASCRELASIIIPNSVINIGYQAFGGCWELDNVTIPDSVESIGGMAFFSCDKLSNIIFPDTVLDIGENILRGTSYYENEGNWENNMLYIGKHLIASRGAPNEVSTADLLMGGASRFLDKLLTPTNGFSGDYVIKNGTKTIAAGAFKDRSSLESITIPNSVTSIGKGAFWQCSELASIKFNGSVAQWNAIKKDDFNFNVPATKVVCSDGEVKLKQY